MWLNLRIKGFFLELFKNSCLPVKELEIILKCHATMHLNLRSQRPTQYFISLKTIYLEVPIFQMVLRMRFRPTVRHNCSQFHSALFLKKEAVCCWLSKYVVLSEWIDSHKFCFHNTVQVLGFFCLVGFDFFVVYKTIVFMWLPPFNFFFSSGRLDTT